MTVASVISWYFVVGIVVEVFFVLKILITHAFQLGECGLQFIFKLLHIVYI